MTYSFRVRGSNKAEATAAVAAEFDKVVVSHEVHKTDRDMVVASAASAIYLLSDDDRKDISVECSGYLCWDGQDVDGVPQGVTNVSVSISVAQVPR
jgi:hypothetical protein